MPETLFRFKEFKVVQERSVMRINTDGVLLGAWVNIDECKDVLDIGTGTGVIALMMAQRNAEVDVDGVEIDLESYEEAKLNMENSPWNGRLNAIHSPVQALDFNKKYDHIVSNPPFFSGGTLSFNNRKEIGRHTTRLSHQELLQAVRKLTREAGNFSVILPYIEGLRFIEIAEQYALNLSRYCEVLSFPDGKVERLLLTFSKTKLSPQKETISIRDNAGNYSDGYVKLTQSFYLAM